MKAALCLEGKRQNFFKECESTVTFRIGGFDWYDRFGTRQNGYTLPSYDHKINVWGGAGGGQTWQRINTYITAIKLLLRPIKLQFQ